MKGRESIKWFKSTWTEVSSGVLQGWHLTSELYKSADDIKLFGIANDIVDKDIIQ